MDRAGRRRLAALRVAALGIHADDAPGSPAEVAQRLLALQAQDYAGTLWAIGLRSAGATAASVDAAFRAGALVRSWPLRSTLHAVPPADLGWLLDLTAEREHRAAAGRHRQLGLEPRDFERAAETAWERLGSGPLERRALIAAIADAGIDVGGQRGAHLLVRIAQSKVAVVTGKGTWTRYDRVVTAPRTLDREAALRELAVRYLRSHGPATDQDLARWAGLPVTDARAGIAAAGDELERVEIDGTAYWQRPGLEPAAGDVHLLPGFDEYLLGYRDRSAQLAGAGIDVVAPGKNGMFLPTIVVDGEVAGLWRRIVRRDRVELAAEPFAPLPRRVREGVERAAERFGRFLGLPATVEFVAGSELSR